MPPSLYLLKLVMHMQQHRCLDNFIHSRFLYHKNIAIDWPHAVRETYGWYHYQIENGTKWPYLSRWNCQILKQIFSYNFTGACTEWGNWHLVLIQVMVRHKKGNSWLQSGAVITRCNVPWYFIQHCSDPGIELVTICTTNGWAVVC